MEELKADDELGPVMSQSSMSASDAELTRMSGRVGSERCMIEVALVAAPPPFLALRILLAAMMAEMDGAVLTFN